MSGLALARAAESHVGAPFRLRGRDPATGLDCLGLVLAALAEIGRPVRMPLHYAPRNLDLKRFEALPGAAGLAEVRAQQVEPGDVLLLETGPGQFHLAIADSEGAIVHAHAGLRRVVRTPPPAPWPIARRWRLLASSPRQD